MAPERVRGEALLCLPQRLMMFVGQAWLAEGDEERSRPTTSTSSTPGGRARSTQWPAEAGEALRADGALADDVNGPRGRRRPAHLQPPEVDLLHALLHLPALLICAFAAGKPEPLTFVLGLTHGLLWIAMSLACIAAARLRIVSLRLAVAVAVLGGIGPFFGS